MDQALSVFKALSDGNRLRTIMALMNRRELCVCEITEMLSLATATVSRHMSVLLKAGLVRSQKKGRWVYYRIHEDFPTFLESWLNVKLASDPDVKKDRQRLDGILGRKGTHSCRQREGGTD